MRFRLRTLLIVVAVAAAIIGAIRASFLPVAVNKSLAGNRAIRQLADADSIWIELYIDGITHRCELSASEKGHLASWLKTAFMDVQPKKHTMLGYVKFGGEGAMTGWYFR